MFDIVHELTIATSPAAVYAAVTTAEGLAGWLTTDVATSGELGSDAVFGFESHTVTMTMRIDAVDAPELVQWTCIDGPDEWAGTSVAFRIEPDANDPSSSVVRLWHGNWEYENGVMPRVSFRWALELDSLRRYLETGTGSPAT